MKVKITPEALVDQGDWRFLDSIIGKVADGWHVWQIDGAETIENSGWLQGRSWLRELFEKAALASAYPIFFPKREIVVGNGNNQGVLPPRQAAEYTATPLTILMENRFTDGLFISTVLKFLASEEVKELLGNVPNVIDYDSPGGIGELPKLVRDYVGRARNSGIPLRAVVFTDCDGNIPGEIHDNAQRVRQACEDENIPCWILNKRTIENYIPDEVLEAWIPYEKSCLEAIKRLNPEQRDYYPMKKGLDLSKAKDEVKKFYEEVSDADKTELAKGFGEVIEKLREFSDAITPEALRKRDGRGELDQLVALISDEL